MTFVYDFNRTVQQLLYQREQKVSATKDPLVEQLYVQSPINFDAYVIYNLEVEDEHPAKRATTHNRRGIVFDTKYKLKPL